MLAASLLLFLISPSAALLAAARPACRLGAARRTLPLASASSIRVASSDDHWAAAALLHETFGGQTLYYYATLRAPTCGEPAGPSTGKATVTAGSRTSL